MNLEWLIILYLKKMVAISNHNIKRFTGVLFPTQLLLSTYIIDP